MENNPFEPNSPTQAHAMDYTNSPSTPDLSGLHATLTAIQTSIQHLATSLERLYLQHPPSTTQGSQGPTQTPQSSQGSQHTSQHTPELPESQQPSQAFQGSQGPSQAPEQGHYVPQQPVQQHDQQPVQQPFQQPLQQPQPPLVNAFSESIIKDFNKRVYKFPETAKLQGPDNFDQWKQALEIQFRALGLPEFLSNPAIAHRLSDPDQAIVLMMLKDSLSEGPQAAITWYKSPAEAFNLLVKQYSYSAEVQRGYLYSRFHSLSF